MLCTSDEGSRQNCKQVEKTELYLHEADINRYSEGNNNITLSLYMPDFTLLFDFSRQHCVAICAVLVPFNLVATLQTMLLTWFGRPLPQIMLMATVSSVYALLLLLHVYTWLAIGVVMLPTYILTVLSGVCWLINFAAVAIALNQRAHQHPRLVEAQD